MLIVYICLVVVSNIDRVMEYKIASKDLLSNSLWSTVRLVLNFPSKQLIETPNFTLNSRIFKRQ